MRNSIEKLMNKNLIEFDLREIEFEIDMLIEKDKKLNEFANNCVLHIQDKKTYILCDYYRIGKIIGEFVNDGISKYKITKELFKNIEKEREKISKKVKKLSKKRDKLTDKKKLFEEDN